MKSPGRPAAFTFFTFLSWGGGRNFDENKSVGTHWIALYVNANNIVYFDSFRVEHIPKHRKQKYYNKY